MMTALVYGQCSRYTDLTEQLQTMYITGKKGGKTDMEIRFFTKEIWQESPFHFHDQMEILLIMSEGESFYIRDKIYPISRGSIFILNSSDLHRSVPKPRSIYQYYSIRFYQEEVEGISTEDFDLLKCFRNHNQFNHMNKLNIDQIDHLLKLINKIEYYLASDCSAFGKDIFARTLLAEVLVYINFLYDTPLLTQVPSEEQISAYYPVIDYINEHITEKISLDLLAQNFYVSKYYLSHRFKDLTGMTITDYIIRRRLTLAKSYLRQGLSVMLAGERAGFNSNNHFIHTFTKTVGMSPKQYARQYLTLDSYVSPTPPKRDIFTR
ncbi:helix-turn-helix transcriptional regulator [Blautia marasmi]|nr:AraC family transcriptional regulator [Blautia marasmi]